jgi:hypothetical protein
MISFAIDGMGAADDACVGDGLVGEGLRYEVEYQRDGRSKGAWTR